MLVDRYVLFLVSYTNNIRNLEKYVILVDIYVLFLVSFTNNIRNLEKYFDT